MALYYYKCSKCGTSKKRITGSETAELCIKCGISMVRSPRPPSSKIMEVIDNGFMPRRVERLVDIKEIMKERSDKHSRENTPNDKTQEN